MATNGDPTRRMGELIGQLLVKTFYGHTVGEVLALAVALERAVDETIARGLGRSGWAQVELIEQVLGSVPRDQKLKVLGDVLRKDDSRVVSAIVEQIRALYRVRDQFAHGALSPQAMSEGGWQLTSRRRGVEKDVELHPMDVEAAINGGKDALEDLLNRNIIG